MPNSPGAYHEIVRGGEVTPVGLVPPNKRGKIDFRNVVLSLGAPSQVDDVTLMIIRRDGTPNPDYDAKIVDVRKGQQEMFELAGGNNHDALAVIDMTNVPSDIVVAVLVEFDA